MRALADPEMASALMAETEVSRFLGVAWQMDLLQGGHVLDAFSSELLREAVRGIRPGARELLAILGSVAPQEVAADAAEHLAELSEPEPGSVASWYGDVGRWRLTRTFRVHDDDGDTEQWSAVFAGPDGTENHVVVWLVDVWDNGAVRDVYAVDQVDEVVARIEALGVGDSETHLDHPDPALLHAVVGAGMRLTDITVPNEESEEAETYLTFRALAHGRLRLLPPPVDLPEPIDADARATLVEDFIASPYALALTQPPAGEEAADQATVRYVAGMLVDHAVDYTGGDPLRVSPLTVEVFMLDWVQRKAVLDPDDARFLPDIVQAWTEYAFEASGRPVARRVATLAAVEEFTEEFTRLVGTGERRGFGAQMVARLLEEGVDMGDPEQLAAAIERYNASLDG